MKRYFKAKEEIPRKKTKIFYEDENEYEDKENISENIPKIQPKNEAKNEPIKLSIMIPKAKYPTPIYEDEGYETEGTIPEEEYTAPADYKAPEKSAYQTYLEMTDISKRNYDDGYETDETVTGGKKRVTKRRNIKGKKTKRKQHRRRKTHKRFSLRKYKKKTMRKH